MENPFKIIESKLSNIETLLLDLKHDPCNRETKQDPSQFMNIKETASFLNLAVPTIYSKVSRGELPVMKRGKLLYFSRIELMDYVKAGRKKTISEIEAEADQYLTNCRKSGKKINQQNMKTNE